MTDYSAAQDAVVETPDGFEITCFPAKEHKPMIEWSYPEFQSLCPVSDRHDQGIVTIQYKPANRILESKSVRDYLMMWRNKKNWQEYITDEIADTLYKASEPEWMTVQIDWAPRGGILARNISRRGKQPQSEDKP